MKTIIYLLAALSLLIAPSHGFTKTYAYFIGPKANVTKLDTDTNAVTQLILKNPENVDIDKVLGADTVNKRLYLTHCVRLGPCKVGAYNLNTLSFIKELSLIADEPDVQMIIFTDGSNLVLQYHLAGDESGEGGYTTDLYDAKTLTEIKNLSTIFNMESVMFSADSKKIYSVVEGAEAKVDIIDSSTFQSLVSRDLTQFWRKKPEVFSSGVKSFGNGKILIFENLQAAKGLPRKLDLYSYDIETQKLSPRISTGLQGDAAFTPDGSKIILDENQDVREKIGGESYLMGFKSLGRMHIYDVATGKELKMISFKPQGSGKIRGIRPAGDRVYYESEGSTKNSSNITVIDIKNYQVLTTISLPFKPLSVIFFEQ